MDILYAKKSKIPSLVDKTCRYCCDIDVLTALEGLPNFEPILESEAHVITECPGYHHLRCSTSDELKSHLLLLQYSYIMSHPILVQELGIFLKRSFDVRNPKRGKKN